MSGFMRGLLPGHALQAIGGYCQLLWSLDTDEHFLGSEKRALDRLLPARLRRPLEADEKAAMHKLANMFPSSAAQLLAAGRYESSRQKAQDKTQQPDYDLDREAGRDLGRALIGDVCVGKLSTVLVMCSLRGWLAVFDALEEWSFKQVRLLSSDGWSTVSVHWHKDHDVLLRVLLRRGVLRFQGSGVDLWLLRTPNPARAERTGITARDLRAATMAVSARLSQLVEVGLEPARDEALRRILLRLEELDFEHRLAVRCGLQLGKRKKGRGEKDGEEGEVMGWVELRDSERVTYGAAYESEVRAARVWERKDDRVGPDTIAL